MANLRDACPYKVRLGAIMQGVKVGANLHFTPGPEKMD